MMASTGVFRKPLKTTMIALMDMIGDRYLFGVVGLGTRVMNGLFRGDFRMQSPPVPFTVYYDGVDSVMFEEFPSGEAMRHLAKNLDERNALIRDPEFRKQFKAEIKKKFAPKVWHRDLSDATVLKAPDASLVGKDSSQIDEERGLHPVDCFLDLIVEYDKQIRWTTTIANDRPEKYPRLYNFPYNLISFADSGAHLNNMAFYDFPLQMIKVVQDSIDAGEPMMSMEKCIWRLTGEQADWFGLDCGYLRPGKPADLVLIDPAQIGAISDQIEEAPIDEFDGFMRLVTRHPGGVSQVVVGGSVVYDGGDFVAGYGKDQRYGRFLRYHGLEN